MAYMRTNIPSYSHILVLYLHSWSKWAPLYKRVDSNSKRNQQFEISSVFLKICKDYRNKTLLFVKKRFTYLLDNGDKVGAFHGKC